MYTTRVQSHINIAYLLPAKNFAFYILCTYNYPPYWQLDLVKNNKNKKKVVARVVGFMPLQHKLSPPGRSDWNTFSVLESSEQGL